MRAGWFTGMLLGTGVEAHVEYVRWNGRPAAFSTDRAGSTVFGHAERDVVVELRAFVPGDPTRGEMALELLPAVSGRVRVAGAQKLRARVRDRALGEQLVAREGTFSTGAGTLAVELVDPADAETEAARPDLVLARAGLGLTVGEGELRGRGHVVWEVRHGELREVSLTATGLGDDLVVEGPNVREWTRSGDRIEVELQTPSRDRVDLRLRWSTPVSKATESTFALPRLEPHDAFRTESSVQLARDGEIEVIPALDGWKALAAAQVPEWGQGLVEGTPTASFEVAGSAEGSLKLLRFVPVEGPPVVVDVAGYQVATSREGRIMIRAHYEIRNERSAHLRVEPPPGMSIIGARVQGETALPARDEGGAWLIPLARSVETVDGLLSFPVEVILMGESDDWARRERRGLTLPVLDAPVAVSRLTLYLPPGYRSLLEPGEADVVPSFTEGEGISYGMGVGAVGAGEADALFQQAVDAWLDNDFDAAQGRIDQLRELGASNENIDKLQANLQVVRGEATGKKVDVTMERRIKEQAKARAIEDLEKERDAKQKAEELKKAGDYVAAEQEYRRALDIGRRLEMLEQTESVEQQTKNIAYEENLAELEEDARRQEQERARHEAKEPRFASKSGGKAKAKKRAAKPNLDATFGASTSDGLEAPLAGPSSGSASGLETETSTIAGRARARHGTVIDVESIENLPVGSETSRDFTAVIETGEGGLGGEGGQVPEEPMEEDEEEKPDEGYGGRDSAGISLAGTTAADPADVSYHLEGANMDAPAARRSLAGSFRRVVTRGRNRRASRRADNDPAAAMPPPAPPPVTENPAELGSGDLGGDAGTVAEYEFLDDEIAGELVRPEGVVLDEDALLPPDDDAGVMLEGEPAPALDRLPDPTTHATAMSVTIPTAGEAVLYQRLLLAAGATLTVDVEAREPLLERNRR